MEKRIKLSSPIHIENSNPCEKPCMPFNAEYCILKNSQVEQIETYNRLVKKVDNPFIITVLARTMCQIFVETQNLAMDCVESNDTANFWKSVTEKLSRDELTGLLTGNGLEAILDEIYAPNTLNKILDKNYYARIVYADVNDLKKHNSGPGGHQQGDMAIATVGGAIYNYVKAGRRSNQIINEKDDRRKALQIPRVIAARSNERGDEFFLMSLNSKSHSKNLVKTKETLDRMFSGLFYYYDGIKYDVSATYGITEVKMPETREKLREVIKRVDVAMMEHKTLAKNGNDSVGIIVPNN